MKNYKENMTDSVAFLYIRMKKIMIKQEDDARKCEKNWLVKLERQTIDQKKIIRKAIQNGNQQRDIDKIH